MNSDLISREWLEKQIYVSTNCYLQAHKDAHFDVYKRGWNDAIDYIIDNAPTVEPERPKGKWVFDGWGTYCSECGYRPKIGCGKFCSECGAQMNCNDK